CTEHVDGNEDYLCDVCGAELERPEPPVCTEHVDENEDYLCDVCGAELERPEPPVCTEHVDGNEDYLCDVCGAELEKPALPEYEDVRYYLNISDLTAEKLTADSINGKFTIVSGTEIRNRTKKYTDPETGAVTEYLKSVKLGGSANLIKVEVPGDGKLAFIIQNGSSGAATQKVKITAPDGTVSEIEFAGTNEASPLVKIEIDVTEGVWTIARVSGTVDIYELELVCRVEKSPEVGFELVSTGNVDFLAGQTLDCSGLRINAVFASGKTESIDLANVTVDTSAVDMLTAGTYEITVSYKDYEPIKYRVNVYEPKELLFGKDAVEKLSANTSADNGVYFNHSLKEVYSIWDDFDKSGLTVIVSGELDGVQKEFIVDDYSINGFDSISIGEKTITVTYTYGGEEEKRYVYNQFTVYVIDTEPSVVDGVYQVRVDSSYMGVIGAIFDGYNMFTTIQQALDFLERAEASANKVIDIVDNGSKYVEKIEITIPNLTIRGNGATVEWDSLYGELDASGFSHVTDSTQTVAIRESAVNCRIENLIISNKWNSKAVFDEAFGEGKHSEHRALALLVQADRFIMVGGGLIGYQDTVEFFTGRQLLDSVYICGTTDFIFGTNNTTLFSNCHIHSITSGKTDGGYITAFKGSNKGESDSVEYGVVFYKCQFTADEDVVANGNTAIGRCWAGYSAVAIIGCELDGHISTKGFSGSSKNERYVSMNAKPTDAGVKFREYGNTGAGAITEEVAGMKLLTAEEADNYSNFEVIFGTTNGNVTYAEAWNPAK
ncbi:MAG: pectinesterase family protein, partial [Eubacteriales bacterium]